MHRARGAGECVVEISANDCGVAVERYRDNADYFEHVKAAATALERDGYLLPEDAKRIVQHAEKLTW
jgi:hypothetical protein